MTKRKTETAIEVLPSEPPQFNIAAELEKAVQHLLTRVVNAKVADEMTVAEETAAIKACTAYYLDVVKDTPQANGEGAFNGFREQIAAVPSHRRARNGSRDGATDDPGGF